jgi:hypothetical protein
LSLAILARDPVSPGTVDDAFPPVRMCGDLPGYALDMFTREGRKAIGRLLHSECQTTAWVRQHVVPANHLSFMGDALFYVEGGLLAKRVDSNLDRQTRRLAEAGGYVPACPRAEEVLPLLAADLSLLNTLRAEHV